jgi:hypothetical protein
MWNIFLADTGGIKAEKHGHGIAFIQTARSRRQAITDIRNYNRWGDCRQRTHN